METKIEPKMTTPQLPRPNPGLRVQTGVKAGPGGVTHTDKWVQRW